MPQLRSVLSAAAFSGMLAAARCGSPEAVGQLLTTYWEYLLHLANRWMPRDLQAKADGADLVQETVLIALKGFDLFEGTAPTELAAWLRTALRRRFQIFVRACRNGQRQDVSRELQLADAEEQAFSLPGEPCPSTELTEAEDMLAIQCVIATLSGQHQEILQLRFYDSLSFPKIGIRLGITNEAARKRCTRAMEAAALLLEPLALFVP